MPTKKDEYIRVEVTCHIDKEVIRETLKEHNSELEKEDRVKAKGLMSAFDEEHLFLYLEENCCDSSGGDVDTQTFTYWLLENIC